MPFLRMGAHLPDGKGYLLQDFRKSTGVPHRIPQHKGVVAFFQEGQRRRLSFGIGKKGVGASRHDNDRRTFFNLKSSLFRLVMDVSC